MSLDDEGRQGHQARTSGRSRVYQAGESISVTEEGRSHTAVVLAVVGVAIVAIIAVVVVVLHTNGTSSAAQGKQLPAAEATSSSPAAQRVAKASTSASVDSSASSAQSAVGPPVTGFSGGCAPFLVYAQNRYGPPGTKKMTAPNPTSVQIGGFPANITIAVDGWVIGQPALPLDSAPWNSDVWFHLADGSGWVSFPGVRAVATTQDPSGGYGLGGEPAPTAASCQGAVS